MEDVMTTFNRRSFLRGGTAAALGAGIGLQRSPGMPARAQSATPVGATPVSSALEDLRSRLNGTLMLPDDSGYTTASAPANGRYGDIRPAAVARCADEADVVTCINWCNENGVPPVGRGGGHSYAGFSTTNGLLIDLRRLNTVQVDKRNETVTCGGAALNNDFFIATENGPLFLPGGTCLGVGIGGLTLGGGIGYNTHWAGLTADHLTASRIVTAAGDVLDLDASTNDDLFWACRGGAGGSFGINTSFTFNLLRVPEHTIAWYRFDWRGADAAAEVLSAFQQMLTTAPAALNAVAMAEVEEIGAGGPREAIHVMSRGQYIGSMGELQEIIEPLLKIAGSTQQTLTEMPFWGVQRMIATPEPESHSFGDISRFAKEPLPDDVIAKMVGLLADCPSRSADANGSIWSLGWVGGDVVGSFGRTDTAYVHRDALTLWRPTTVWPDDASASVGDGLNAWTDQVIAAMQPYTPDESYQNFPNRAIQNAQQQYYAENLDRLIDIKTTYDPGNLFNNPQSVPVRA
jgi:FAD/FMN-containing dehydrogenase